MVKAVAMSVTSYSESGSSMHRDDDSLEALDDDNSVCSDSSSRPESTASLSSKDSPAVSRASGSSTSETSSASVPVSVAGSLEGMSTHKIQKREHLWELCCHPQSGLTQCCVEAGLRCRRLTLETRFDFAKAAVAAKAVGLAERRPPLKIWMSPPCTFYSPLQNLRRAKTRRRMKRLKQQRAETDLIVSHCAEVAKPVVLAGGHMYFEWSSRCHGWKHCSALHALLRWLDARSVRWFKVRVHACVWGLHSVRSNELMGKCAFAARMLLFP